MAERAKLLSDITGERAFTALADLLPPVLSLAKDQDAVTFFTARTTTSRLETTRQLLSLVSKHKTEFLEIEAVKRGCAVGDLPELSLEDIFTAATELMNDSLFICFFVLAHKDRSTSTCAPETTEDRPG